MKKQIFIIILCTSILLLMLTGCKREGVEPNKNPDNQYVDENDGVGDEDNTNTTWNQPDTIIRWGIPDILRVSDETLNQFNQGLTEKGHDFMVEFIPLDYDNYYESLKKYEENHGSLDIAYAGLNTEFDNKSYDLIKSGYFTALDDYLKIDKSSNNEAEELYQLFDSLLWDSIKVDGSIYSIPNGVAKDTGEKFVFNKKYITQEELQDFTGDIWQLKEYMERIPMKKDFSHLVYGLELFGFANLIECDYKYGLILSHDEKGAYNPFEAEKIKEYYRTFKDYYKSGYINYNLSFLSDEKQEEIINEYLRSGDFFVYIYSEDSSTKDIEINADVYTIDTDYYMRSRLSGTTGIAMESTKKDEAFELLSLVHTDKEFANLLVYGRKGVDYQLVDGIAYDMDGGSPDPFINELLLGIYENLYPTKVDNFVVDRLTDKREYYKNHVKPSPYLGIHLDIKGYESIIKDIKNIVEENIDIWKSDDLEAEFARVAKLLKDAGIDDLIVDMNKQLGVD